jgi:hypothetical protein
MRALKLLLWPISFITRPLGRWITSQLHARSGEAAARRRRARRLAKAMQSEFSRLGFVRTTVTGKKRNKVRRQRIKFDSPLLLTQDELWCPIKPGALPTGITSDDLRAEETVRALEDRLNTGVCVDSLPTHRLVFVVRLGGSTFPEKFSLNNAEIPPDAPQLAVPLGVDCYGDQVIGDLVAFKHLLIAGATGGGKTTLYHSIITTLISRNNADSLELWLIDMKRTEFSLYRPLMGKKGETGIVRHIAVDPDDAVDLLGRAYKEIVQRNQHMERMGVTSIGDLEQSTGQRLKRLVLLVDEFAILTTDSTRVGKQTVGSWSKLLMTRIAALGRSAGVSILIATQMVKKEVIDGMISANFENRIAFSCATWRESNLVISSSDAVGLPDGRAILRVEGRTKEVQTCFVTPGQVKLEIARVAEFGPDGGLGDEDTRRFVRDAKLLLSSACAQLGGDFPRAKLLALDGIRGVITYEAFDEIARRLERDGVLEAGGPRRPRRVSRAFFGRPNLLDQFYGIIECEAVPSQAPRVTQPEPLRDKETGSRGTHQDAGNGGVAVEEFTEYEMPESGARANTQTSDEDDEGLPLPPGFEKLFADLTEEEQKPKKKRKK